MFTSDREYQMRASNSHGRTDKNLQISSGNSTNFNEAILLAPLGHIFLLFSLDIDLLSYSAYIFFKFLSLPYPIIVQDQPVILLQSTIARHFIYMFIYLDIKYSKL